MYLQYLINLFTNEGCAEQIMDLLTFVVIYHRSPQMLVQAIYIDMLLPET